jgi:hypothetical protein
MHFHQDVKRAISYVGHLYGQFMAEINLSFIFDVYIYYLQLPRMCHDTKPEDLYLLWLTGWQDKQSKFTHCVR